MVEKDPDMPTPDDKPKEAFDRLDEELSAFEKTRVRSAPGKGALGSIDGGYRIVAELIGGVGGGFGLGWLVDRFAHTAPWGWAIGISAGAGFGLYMAAYSAVRMGKQAMEKAGPAKSVPFDDDED